MANDDDDQDGFSALDMDKKDLDDMTKALRKLEQENRSLFEEIRHLRDRLCDEKADQSDVYYYLHKRLDDNYEVISALERQLVVEATYREKAEMEYEKQIEELQHRRDEELAPLKEKLTALEGLVNSMDEVANNKRESDARRARLEKEIESTRSIIESDLNVEQRKKLQEKQRVKREIEEHIEQLSIELSSKKEAELAEKTLQAAEKNQKLHALLHSKAKQAERMMIVNQGLAFENSRIRNDVDLANVSEAALGERVRVYEDLVNGLKAKLEQMGYFDNDKHDRELGDLEEALSRQSINSTTMSGTMGGSLTGLHTMSLASDTSPGVQDDSPDGFFGGLPYESADELRVAIKGLKHLHQELKGEAQHLTVCADKENTARAASKGDDDPLVVVLLDAAQKWVSRSKSNVEDREGEIEEENKASLVSRTDSDNRGESRDRQRRNVGGSGRTKHNRMNNRSSPETPKTEMEQTIRRGLTHERGGFTAWQVDSGPLAKLTASPFLRRELFYNLVEAFRDYQTKSRRANEATVDNSDPKNCPDGTLVKTLVTDGTPVRGTGESLTHDSSDTQNDVVLCTHARDECSGASMSDLSSVSVCTLGEQGNMERRNASTQTVPKVDVKSVHFPEKFAAVRATRRRVIKNTFPTTNSTFTARSGRSGGFGTLSTDSQLNRR